MRLLCNGDQGLTFPIFRIFRLCGTLACQNGLWLFSVLHVIPLARVPSCLWAETCKVCRNNAPSVVSREWFTTMSSLAITQRQEPVLPCQAGGPRSRCVLLCSLASDVTMAPRGSASRSDPHPTKLSTSGRRWALSCSTARRVMAAWGCVRAVAPLTIVAGWKVLDSYLPTSVCTLTLQSSIKESVGFGFPRGNLPSVFSTTSV